MDVTNYGTKCSNKIGNIVTRKSGFLRTLVFFIYSLNGQTKDNIL